MGCILPNQHAVRVNVAVALAQPGDTAPERDQQGAAPPAGMAQRTPSTLQIEVGLCFAQLQ